MKYDIVIEGAEILDGTGAPAYRSDIGIRGEVIEKIGDLKGAEADRRIDAAGKTVCPGFIDAHSHADLAFFRKDHREVLTPLVRQGITTFVGGNCGMALSPISESRREGQEMYLEVFTQMDFDEDVHWTDTASFMKYMDKEGPLLNTALLAPHGMMRIAACGLETRLAEKKEIAHMRDSLEASLDAGVFGLSTGLQYFPGNQSDTAELVELGRSLVPYDGIFTSHLRSYTATTLEQAIDEVAEVSRVNGVRTQVSHIFSLPWLGPIHNQALKVLKWFTRHPDFAHRAVPNFAIEMEMKKILKILDRQRASGALIGMDVMPTTAGFTHLMAYFPSWSLAGGREAILERLSDPATRAEILHDIDHGVPKWPHRGKDDWSLNLMRQMGWDAITVMAVHSEENKKYEGRLFTDIGKEKGKHPFDVMCDMLLEEDGRVLAFESLAEPDDYFTEKYTFPALKDPQTMVTTDTILLGMGKPSYLFYGCYPKFIGRYVFDKKLLGLPEAVARCTSLPADWFGIENRGRIKEGNFADILIMKPEEFRTEAVFRDPERFPTGLETVLINGNVVFEGGEMHLEEGSGKMLRRQDQAPSS